MHIDDLKTMLLASALQHGQITLTAVTKTEIVTNDQTADTQLANQQLLDKIFGTESGEGFIELQAKDPINGVMLQRLQFLAEPGQTGRWITPLCRVTDKTGKIFLRMGLEHHDQTRKAQLLRLTDQLRQDCLMPEVDTIKVPDCHDTAPMPFTQVVTTANQLHQSIAC